MGRLPGAQGILEPLDDRIKQDGYDLSDFVPAALDQQRYDGKLYALPITALTTALLYNEDLLAEAGIAPPKTTSELAEAIAKLTKVDSNGNITQLGLNQPSLADFAFQFGGQWANDKGEPTPDDPGNIAALNFVMDQTLGGGVTRSLALDAHGKSLSSALLDLEIDDSLRS